MWRPAFVSCSCLLAAACLAATGVSAGEAGQAGRTPLDQRSAHLWSRSCALCHVTGNGGAPRVGHPEEWQPRLAQGRDALLAHTVEGYNRMPPLGYCMACGRDDFLALIDFMAGGAVTRLSEASDPDAAAAGRAP